MLPLLSVLKSKYLPFFFALPLFLCVYRYNGIVMDAILYVTQYVYSIDPTRFSGDPSFDFGNQESLGLFSPFLGLFLEPFGIATGSFIHTFFTQLIWVVAFVFFVRNLLRLNWQRLWILPTTILMVCVFANGMPFAHTVFFNYLSTYVCSRSLSVVLGLCGTALIFRQKKAFSLLIILVGMAVHPLTAGWCLPFWIFYFYPKTMVPITFSSFVFPFTFLLHFKSLDIYPPDWLTRPLDRPGYELLSLYVFFFVFFRLLAKYPPNKKIRKVAISLFLTTAIALYWNLWGGFGEHILLYQVQPWRALWLPSMVAAPLGICLVKDVFRNYLKKKTLSTHGLVALLFFVSFFLSAHLFSVSLAAIILFSVNKKNVSLINLILAYGCVILGGYVVQQYMTWSLQGLPSIYILSIWDLYCARDSFFIYQIAFAICFIVFLLKKRQFIPSLILLLSLFFARFMLLPALALFVAFFPSKSTMKYWSGLCLIILLIIFDGTIGTEARSQTLFHGLPPSFFKVFLLTTLSFASIWLSKWFSYKSMIVWLLICCSLAIINYSGYYTETLGKEKQLNPYLHKTIFPQIRERGHIFFFVSGNRLGDPRLQFMTGSYFNNNTKPGIIFYKGHYREALERSHLLYWKDRSPESDKFIDYPTILLKLADTDTLIDRIEFLCRKKEIHHVVTDKKSLPFAKEDSTLIESGQKVYLYTCPVME